MSSFTKLNSESKDLYIKLLATVAKLSGLFSESSIPFINYRIVENIYCKSFNAKNLSRADGAFDAILDSVGIGIKTFTCPSNISTEKIAEFNSLSDELKKYEKKDLAIKLSEYRNERIELANGLYDIKNSLYHIVARKEKELNIFETDYEKINVNKISIIKNNKASLQFEDGKNFYLYNFSKSTLYRKFQIPKDAYSIPVEIIEDPYKLLLELFESKQNDSIKTKLIKGFNYIILPLYAHKKNGEKFVFEKSGLNQWNAGGRKRNFGEVYIPIPAEIHHHYSGFFPNKEIPFNLSVPTGETFIAKVCQDRSKALMTNPNASLANWLLRKVLQLKEGELATIDKLNQLNFDSVIIYKLSQNEYKIDMAKFGSFEKFILD